MIDVQKIVRARLFAKKAHEGQKDDSGKDYFEEHCDVVGKAIQSFTKDTDVICAAYLHDVLEDTIITAEDLRKKFGERVADLVAEVTHEGQKDAYGYYFPRLKSKEAILIKLIDRASNISRMDPWSEERQQQYLKKTKFWKDGSDRKSPGIFDEIVICKHCQKKNHIIFCNNLEWKCPSCDKWNGRDEQE